MAQDQRIHIGRSGKAWLDQAGFLPATRKRYERVLLAFYWRFRYMPLDPKEITDWLDGLKMPTPHKRGPRRSVSLNTKRFWHRVIKMHYEWTRANYDHPGARRLPDLPYHGFGLRKWEGESKNAATQK